MWSFLQSTLCNLCNKNVIGYFICKWLVLPVQSEQWKEVGFCLSEHNSFSLCFCFFSPCVVKSASPEKKNANVLFTKKYCIFKNLMFRFPFVSRLLSVPSCSRLYAAEYLAYQIHYTFKEILIIKRNIIFYLRLSRSAPQHCMALNLFHGVLFQRGKTFFFN